MDNLESATTCNPLDCPQHFHANDSIFADGGSPRVSPGQLEEQQTARSETHTSESTLSPKTKPSEEGQNGGVDHSEVPQDRGFGRIIRNFTPS